MRPSFFSFMELFVPTLVLTSTVLHMLLNTYTRARQNFVYTTTYNSQHTHHHPLSRFSL